MNEELLQSIKNMFADGITPEEINAAIDKVQEEQAKESANKEKIIARECLINAVLTYCKVLGIADSVEPEDINELRKSLASIESSLVAFHDIFKSNPQAQALLQMFKDTFEEPELGTPEEEN